MTAVRVPREPDNVLLFITHITFVTFICVKLDAMNLQQYLQYHV